MTERGHNAAAGAHTQHDTRVHTLKHGSSTSRATATVQLSCQCPTLGSGHILHPASGSVLEAQLLVSQAQ